MNVQLIDIVSTGRQNDILSASVCVEWVGLVSSLGHPDLPQYCDTCHPDNMNDPSDEFDISEDYFEDNEFVCSPGFLCDELSYYRGSQNGKRIGSRFPS